MQRQLVIEKYPWETRLAIVEDGRLVELHYEEDDDRVGNIYKARVMNVLPGLSCAFVDLGYEKNAFLYQGDLRGIKNNTSISDVLKRDNEILVQVKKEEVPGKGARVTTYLTLPGHYLVFLPYQNDVNISRKVKDPELREELRTYLKALKPKNSGVIVRTAGALAPLQDLAVELDSLYATWQQICELERHMAAPALLYKDLDVVQRVLRDYIDGNTTSIVLNKQEEAVMIKELLSQDAVAQGIKIKVEDAPLEKLGLEREIKRLMKSRVWLKSGGFIIIEETEAMTVIDVNSGKYTGKRQFNQTILKTNLEAAHEIPRQLRLRGIGGIILIDFIDMKDRSHQAEVLQALEQELYKDKAHSRVLGITKLGLVEMTRKKTRASLGTVLAEECQVCEGKGRIPSNKVICHEIMRQIYNLGHRSATTVNVDVRPEILPHLEEQSRYISQIKEQLGKEIVFSPNPDLEGYYHIRS